MDERVFGRLMRVLGFCGGAAALAVGAGGLVRDGAVAGAKLGGGVAAGALLMLANLAVLRFVLARRLGAGRAPSSTSVMALAPKLFVLLGVVWWLVGPARLSAVGVAVGAALLPLAAAIVALQPPVAPEPRGGT